MYTKSNRNQSVYNSPVPNLKGYLICTFYQETIGLYSPLVGYQALALRPE
jgi:hypothetical protein